MERSSGQKRKTFSSDDREARAAEIREMIDRADHAELSRALYFLDDHKDVPGAHELAIRITIELAKRAPR
jgi:hypothetical protein